MRSGMPLPQAFAFVCSELVAHGLRYFALFAYASPPRKSAALFNHGQRPKKEAVPHVAKSAVFNLLIVFMNSNESGFQGLYR
jgi:hypothetical protein